jgi:hypothetical protein
MNRQLYQTGGIMGVARENYGIGSSIKKRIRKIIPNEIADIAVKTAPFVAPFRPDIAAAMRGIGRFDQRGSVSDAAKQAAGIYALGQVTGADGLNIPGRTSSIFGTKQIPGNEVDELLTVDRSLGDVFGDIGDSVSNLLGNIEVPELLKQTPGKILELAQNIVPDDLKGLEKLMRAATYLAGTTISYLDRQRINEAREEIQRKFEAAQAVKRGQYMPSASSTPAPKASFTAADVVRAPARYGGRMNYAYGNSVQDGIMAAPQIADQMGMPVGNPRQNQQGIAELDYRDQGGFVPPIGIKEKEDDIPAMLSNNEFVFTADAVRNAGDGDVNEGARKMYAMMKQLENGGMV